MEKSTERVPKLPEQFRAKWHMSKMRYHSLVNEGVIKQTYTGPRSVVILPEDEDRFVEICRQNSPQKGAA